MLNFVKRSWWWLKCLCFEGSKSKHLNCLMATMQPGYGLQVKHKKRTRVVVSGSTMYCNFQTLFDWKAQQKSHIDDLITTTWWPMYNFQNRHKITTRFTICKQILCSKDTIFFCSTLKPDSYLPKKCLICLLQWKPI